MQAHDFPKYNMKKQKNKSNKIILYLIVIIIILIFLTAIQKVSENKNQINSNDQKLKIQEVKPGIIAMNIPAVDSEENGVPTLLTIETKSGTGKTLVNIESLLFWADTQHSIRQAKLVAENITQISSNNLDLTYNIKAEASIIGGPSAGSALTIATIAALKNQTLNPNIMIIGTINHDGTIGPVSGIFEKAKAAKKTGAEILLVPLLQSRDVIYETRQHCETFGNTEICSTETIPTKINIEEETGIKVIEIENINEAMTYFF